MEQEVIEQEQEKFDINISPYDFNEAKELLKEFAEQSRDELYFDTVKTHDDLFGFEFTEHTVTGKEFNTLVEQTQNYISKFYEKQQETIDAFSQVYKALEGLDKGYIQAIVTTVLQLNKPIRKFSKNKLVLIKQLRSKHLHSKY